MFAEPARAIKRIPSGKAAPGSMHGPRYTSYAKLLGASALTDVLKS